MPIQPLDTHLLSTLSEQARRTPRRRQNLNLHADAAANCHRFFNAMEPDSYVVPHRHCDAGKEETMIVLSGRMALLCFDDAGNLSERHLLSPNGPCFGVHVPLNAWHSVVALESGTVFLEAKGGPYVPLGAADFAPWAPREGSADAAAYLEQLRRLALG